MLTLGTSDIPGRPNQGAYRRFAEQDETRTHRHLSVEIEHRTQCTRSPSTSGTWPAA